MQPLTLDVISIGVGDTVSSPLGPFVIEDIYETSSDNNDDEDGNKPVPSATGVSPRKKKITPVVTMCSGTLIPPEGTTGPPRKVSYQLNMVRKETKVLTLCYDCESKGMSKFHYIGLECSSCHGFNTVQM
jgi:hypothetical protein